MSSQWNQIATLLGPAGFSTQSGSGRPASALGNIGDIYVDTTNAVLYASKTSAGWPASGRSLVGPVTQTQLPNDITGNSLSLAAVSGDSHGVGMSIANSTGTVFAVDGNGNLTAQASTVASLASTGIVTGTTFVSAVGALNNPAFAFNTQIDTGLYLPTTSTTAAVMALVVNATTALTLTKNGVSIPGTLSVPGSITVGTLNASNVVNSGSGSAAGYVSSIAGTVSAPSFSYSAQTDSGLYLATQSASAAVLALAVNGAQALALSKAGVTVPGTLTAQGASIFAAVSAGATSLSTLTASGAGTFAGLLTSPSLTLNGMGGQITFPDGTTQSTAAKTYTPGASATFAATSNGTAAAPAFTYSAQTDSGVYLATASSTAAILALSVNGTQALSLAKGGITVPGTLSVSGTATLAGVSAGATQVSSLANAGNATIGGTLSVSGASTFGAASVTSMRNSGTSTAAGFTISASGGTLTFGDGTVQTTAPVSANVGSSPTFSATNQGSTSSPSFLFSAQTDTGLYLAALGNAASLGFTVNATQALTLTKGGASVPGTLSVSGATTLAALNAASLTTTGNASIGGTLSVSGASTLAAIAASSITTSGLEKAAAFTITASGDKLTFGDGSTQTTAAATANVGVSPTFAATNAGTTTAPSFLFSAQTDSGLYLATTSTSAAVLAFTVNNTQSLAMAASGVTVPGTLTVNGASTFAGSATFASVNMSNLTLSGNLTVNGSSALQALTVTSLSNSGTTTSAGHTVSANGSAGVPSYSFTAQPDTGMYLPTASTSAAVLGFSANGTLALNVLKGGITVPGTLGVTGASTLGAVSASSLAVSGNETIGGTSSIAGLLTASGNITTPVLTTTQAPTVKTVSSTSYTVSNISLPGTFGDGASYPPSGISSDSLGNLLLNYMGVPFIRSNNNGYSSGVGNSPGSAFVTSFLSGSYVFNGGGNTLLALSSTSAKYGFTANTVPFTMQALSGNILVLQNGGTSPNYTTQTVGTVSSAGLATFTGLTLSSTTGITFVDNSVQTTAYTSTSASNQQRYYANSAGTTALPSFTYQANTDTGEYLKTTSTTAAVLALSVNATDALTLTKTGVTVPGTLAVTGTTTLTGTLSAGAINSGALTSSAAVKGTALTITASGGALTFGDGTTQTTAAAAATAGSAAVFAATGNGSSTAPVFSSKQYTNTGLYFNPNTTTSTNLDVTVDGTQIAEFAASAATFKVPMSCTSNVTANAFVSSNAAATSQIVGLLSVSKAATFGSTITATDIIKGATGTAANPAYQGAQDNNTGLSFQVGVMNVSANGVQVCKFASGATALTGTLTISGGVSHSGTTTLTGATNSAATITSTTAAGTPSFVSSQGFRMEVDLGFSEVQSTTANQTGQTWRIISNIAFTSYFSRFYRATMTSSGSILAVIADMGGTLASAQTVTIYKNGSSLGANTTVASNGAGGYTTYSKGTYTFVAGDYLTAFVNYTSAVTSCDACTFVKIHVETSA